MRINIEDLNCTNSVAKKVREINKSDQVQRCGYVGLLFEMNTGVTLENGDTAVKGGTLYEFGDWTETNGQGEFEKMFDYDRDTQLILHLMQSDDKLKKPAKSFEIDGDLFFLIREMSDIIFDHPDKPYIATVVHESGVEYNTLFVITFDEDENRPVVDVFEIDGEDDE